LALENQSTPFVTPTKCTVLIDKASPTCFGTVQVYYLQGEQNGSFIKLLFLGSLSVAAPDCGAQVPKYVADAAVMLY
jgi:hypothetical protein